MLKLFKIFLNKLLTLHEKFKSIPAYQIIKIKNINNNYEFEILITGTGKKSFFKTFEIVNDELFLKKFSIDDIRTILYLNFKELEIPKYSIVSYKYCDGIKKLIFSIKNQNTNEIHKLTAAEISLNKEIIQKCSPSDAHRIGYQYRAEE